MKLFHDESVWKKILIKVPSHPQSLLEHAWQCSYTCRQYSYSDSLLRYLIVIWSYVKDW